jgi:hypothetical protein
MTFAARGGRAAVLFAVSAAAVVLVGCSSENTSTPAAGTSVLAAPTSTSASPSTTLSLVDKDKQDALVAYTGMWDDFVAAAATSDWQSPQLGQYATGLALSTLSRGLYADHYNGLISKGSPTHSAQVSSVDPPSNPTTVIVNDCSDSTTALKYRADSGQPANDSPGGHRLINATVRKQSDRSWKVSDFGVQQVGSC